MAFARTVALACLQSRDERHIFIVPVPVPQPWYRCFGHEFTTHYQFCHHVLSTRISLLMSREGNSTYRSNMASMACLHKVVFACYFDPRCCLAIASGIEFSLANDYANLFHHSIYTFYSLCRTPGFLEIEIPGRRLWLITLPLHWNG